MPNHPAPRRSVQVGRPSRLTEGTHEQIVNYVRAGNYLTTAAGACGISAAVVMLWMSKGRELAAKRGELLDAVEAQEEAGEAAEFRMELTENQIRYLDFYDAITRARSEAQARHVAILSLAGEQDWRASAHYLERTDPKNWGRNDKVTTTMEGNPDKPIVQQNLNMNVDISKEELRARIEAIRERRALSDRLVTESSSEGSGGGADDEIR